MGVPSPKVKTVRHPFGYKVRDAFPNARLRQGFEGGAVYLAERGGKPYIIVDDGTMTDFLGEEDTALLEQLVQVIEFDCEQEREAYLREQYGGAGRSTGGGTDGAKLI
jgi:hypothetical protein